MEPLTILCLVLLVVSLIYIIIVFFVVCSIFEKLNKIEKHVNEQDELIQCTEVSTPIGPCKLVHTCTRCGKKTHNPHYDGKLCFCPDCYLEVTR